MDIDIDFPTNFKPLTIFTDAVPASMVKGDELVKHPCGIYFQNMAIDDITQTAAIPYEEAEVLGYFKIDCLHLSILDHFTSKQEIRNLSKKEPKWEMLLDRRVVEQLFQIRNNYDIVRRVKPTSIQELADVIALIRPNKKILLDSYLKDRTGVRSNLYRQRAEDKSAFRLGHAIAYASTIVLQLHLIDQGRL